MAEQKVKKNVILIIIIIENEREFQNLSKMKCEPSPGKCQVLSLTIWVDTFTAKGHEWMMGWMNEHVPVWWKINPGGTDLWKEVYKNTRSAQKVVAWKQMIQLSGKYMIYFNKVILTIAAVKAFSDKKVFSFTSNLLESQRLMEYQMTRVFPAI